MSINVPVPTVEKPITVIDYIAGLDACTSHVEVGRYSERVPEIVRNDERFGRAVAAKLESIKKARRRA